MRAAFHSWPLAVTFGLLAACGGKAGDADPCPPLIERIRACVETAAQPIEPSRRLPPPRPAPVVLYVDRSGSMTGYLDVEYTDSMLSMHAGASNLRTTLSHLLAVGEEETRVYGFGDSLTALPHMEESQAMQMLVRQDFYEDGDTRTEEALARVRADSTRSSVHLIITDGRRGTGDAAIAQYQQMGRVAAWWTSSGDSAGVFAVIASTVPFRQVRGDSAGCWQSAPGAASGSCPLYIFAFAPAGAAERVLTRLAELNGRMHVHPAVSDERNRIEYTTAGPPSGGEVAVLHTSPLVIGFRSRAPQNRVVQAKVNVSVHANGSAARFSLGDSLYWSMDQAALTGRTPSWTPVHDVSQAWVQPGDLAASSGTATLTLPVDLRTRAGRGATLYRVQVLSRGRPRWLGQVAAVQQRDSVRTYGLSAIFDQLRPTDSRLAGFYVTVY